ncbi:MAG TPA: chemotaxis protein CheA [Firmicutes bacterium]|nr:chemotaxis protein CheA [Candidatus Fermentithermobacillaceae bacterium]
MNDKDNYQEYRQDLEIFLSEVDELLANTEENLVELEKAPSDAALIQEVFRAMHTIKGGAATLGLQDGVEVTHLMESILDEVRSQGRELTAEMVDVLFAVLDYLREWRNALGSDKERPSPEKILARIREFAGNESSVAHSVSQPGTSSAVPRDGSRTVDLDGDGKRIYLLTVRFKSDAPLLSVRAFQVLTLVGEVSEVLSSDPSLDDIENDRVSEVLRIYLTAEDDGKEAARTARGVQDVAEVSLERYDQRVSRDNPAPSGSVAGGAGNEAGFSRDESASQGYTVKKTTLGKTVRVDVALLDFLMDMVGELVIDRTRLTQIATRLQRSGETSAVGNEIRALAAHLQRTSAELQEGIMRARLLPLKNIFTKFPRMVRDLAQRCGKQVEFEMAGEDTELDRTVLEVIDDPLIHILRNAIDHGIETPDERVARGKPPKGRIRLLAWHEENQVLVRVEDDGAGIDPEKIKKAAVKKGLLTEDEVRKLSEKEAIELIFMPGFSTAEKATEVSGRGVGMDVVRTNLERINGHVEVRSQVGLGTEVTLRLPLTLAIMRALLVKCEDLTYAIPTSSVEEVLAIKDGDIRTIQGKPAMSVRGRIFPLISLAGALRDDKWKRGSSERYALLTRTNDEPLALGVDDLLGEEEVVVKEMGRLLSRLKGIAGATILAQGDPAVILDVQRLI